MGLDEKLHPMDESTLVFYIWNGTGGRVGSECERVPRYGQRISSLYRLSGIQILRNNFIPREISRWGWLQIRL